MSVTITTAASNLARRYGTPTFDCDGARIRAHCRHLATVVTIEGRLDAVNVHRVGEHIQRFVLAGNPLVLDLSGVNSFAANALSLLDTFDDECGAADVEWTLVAGDAVSALLSALDDEAAFATAGSVREALRNFADVIAKRRQLLLPLIAKSA